MEAQKNTIDFRRHILAILVLVSSANVGLGQNVYKDYVVDRCTQYSPFDHQQRGLIYKIHTGHAGIFGNCDDDRQKMISPYIDWHCRTRQPNLAVRFVKDLFADTFRKSVRVADGAGACVIGRCHVCQQTGPDCQCQSNDHPHAIRSYNSIQTNVSRTQAEQSRTQVARNSYQKNSRMPPQSKETGRPFTQDERVANRQAFLNFANNTTRQSTTSNQPVRAPQNSHSIAFSARNNSRSTDQFANRPGSSFANQDRSTSSRTAQISESRSRSENAYFAGSTESSSRNSYLRTDDNSGRDNLAETNERASYLDRPAPNRQKDQIDPRFGGSRKLVPQDKFTAIEKNFQSKSVVERCPAARSRSPFQLSNGGVYDRRSIKTGNQSRESSSDSALSKPVKEVEPAKRIRNRVPAPGQRSDPRYFQFQQIGGSKYR